MLDRKHWSDSEWMVLEEYGFRCVLCGFQYADTLHHEPPRSLNPRWIDQPWTQFPLCASHHDVVQDMPREEAKELILRHVDIYAPGAVERIQSKYDLQLRPE
jgi:hypothetical protein